MAQLKGRVSSDQSLPEYPGHGLVTAVQRFWTRVGAARGDRSRPVPTDGRLNLLRQIRSAHEDLGEELRAVQLEAMATEVAENAWVVVGEDVDVDLGVDVAPLVRHYHDRALSTVYASEGQARRVAGAINEDLRLLPRACAGYQGWVTVQTPTDGTRRHRLARRRVGCTE